MRPNMYLKGPRGPQTDHSIDEAQCISSKKAIHSTLEGHLAQLGTLKGRFFVLVVETGVVPSYCIGPGKPSPVRKRSWGARVIPLQAKAFLKALNNSLMRNAF